MRETKDWNWKLERNALGNWNWDQVHASLLMDIRDELQKLNAVIGCSNFLNIPQVLKRISANTHRPKRKRVRK